MSQILKLAHENQQLKRQVSQYKQVLGVSPFIDDSILKGGYRVVKTITDRDKIDCCHRKLGMKVLVIGEDLSFKEYVLKTDDCKKNIWEEVDITVEENEVFLIEDYSELSENLTTQKELNLILKQLILDLQTQIDNIFIEVTKTQLDVLISENKLEPNRLYKITGVESWCFSQHLIKAIYLKAITNNTLESEGVGEFCTPKYNDSDSNLGIWKGELLANEMIDSLSYNIGDKVIWGNLFWQNISGEIGNNNYVFEGDDYPLNNYLSNEDWQLITPNDDVSLYNIQFDSIKYDLENDYINYRADDLGNKYELSYTTLLEKFSTSWIIEFFPGFIYNVNSISLFQWGKINVNNNFINESIVLNCNYNTSFFKNNIILEKSVIERNSLLGVNFTDNKLYNSYFQANKFINVTFNRNNLNFSTIGENILSGMDFNSNILNNSSVELNNFLNVVFLQNKLDNSNISYNELKKLGGIFNNTLNDSRILFNKYYFDISNNRLSNSQINFNNDNDIIVNDKYTIIKDNTLDNMCQISNNIFVEEGKEIDGNIKSIQGNELINNSTINNNTIKNGSRIFGHRLEYYSTINGNTLDTESNIYNNQVVQNGKIDNNILTGHSRIYLNQLDKGSGITLCKFRIYPTTSYPSEIHSSSLSGGIIQNVDFGNIVNPEGTNPNDPNFRGNTLSECIIENNSKIKDLTFPNTGGKFIQSVKMNGFSEFKNITVNDSIRNVDFINTIFNETSDYSKLIEGSGYQTDGFTKTYIDGVLLQDKFDEKQDVLTYTPENVLNKSDSYTASSSNTYASSKALVDGLATKLNKGSYTGTAQDLKNDIDNLQISGINLILGSKIWKNIDLHTVGSIVDGNLKIIESYYENVYSTQIFNVAEDGYYTLSFTCLEFNSDKNFFVEFKNSITGAGINFQLIHLGKNIFTAYLESGNYYGYSFYSGVETPNTAKYIIIANDVKLEKGNKATDWTPAPEDKQDRLQDVTTNIGVGKLDTSATEKLDVNGNIKAIDFKGQSVKFNLQTSISPTPNTLVPKTDGSGLMWYNNSSVVYDLLLLPNNWVFNNSNTFQTSNTAIGNSALISTTVVNGTPGSGGNTAVGYFTLKSLTTGNGNTAFGSNSLSNLTVESVNTGVGFGALNSLVGGFGNTAVGAYALNKVNNTANSAFGYNSLLNATGSFNDAFGYNSLSNITSGGYNCAFGRRAFEGNATGSYNSVFGSEVMQSSSGSNNVALGYIAGTYQTNGTSSSGTVNSGVFIGARVKTQSSNNSTNEIVIGYDAIGTGSNTATIGNDSITNTYLKGKVNLNNRLKLASYTKTQRDALTNKEVGDMIWQTDSGNYGIRVYDGTNWLAVQTIID